MSRTLHGFHVSTLRSIASVPHVYQINREVSNFTNKPPFIRPPLSSSNRFAKALAKFSSFSHTFPSRISPATKVFIFFFGFSYKPNMWRSQQYGKSDVESGGARPLYPMMLERPELRWAFIRKIYSILALQLLATIAVAAAVVSVRPIAVFFSTTTAGLVLYIVLIISPFITLCPLYYYHQKHPVNYLLLGIFTVTLSFAIGLTCAYTSGKVILEAVILTTVVVVSLTLYTFWAAKRGHDFNFLGPFLFGAVLVLMVFAMIQMLFPLGRTSTMVYGCLAAIIFCGYIIYDTDNLIKRYSYDEYIWASISLYLDIVNLFLALLTIFRAADS